MFFLPDDLINSEKSKSLIFYNYISYKDSKKPTKIILNQNLISFLISGEKKLDYYDKDSTVTDKDLAILFSGNCIMKDKTSYHSNKYNNILLFFTNDYISYLYSKYYKLINTNKIKNTKRESFIIIKKDLFINNYIHSLQNLFAINQSNRISDELSLIKFEELMLYFIQNKPNIFQLFVNKPNDKAEYKFKAIIEDNIIKNTKISDLANLLNMSLSTFKRKFKNIYGCSATQYILNRKMEIAEELLIIKCLSPSEIYHLIGYENFSSFSQAFKKRFGESPKKYQLHNMSC